ncbi:MAG: hypothetical protein JW892_08840, partial [Anaerolineae bacterium]|nr:hypothetical protein [Anaerolineae bacterium]
LTTKITPAERRRRELIADEGRLQDGDLIFPNILSYTRETPGVTVQTSIKGCKFWAEARYRECFWLMRYAHQPKTLPKIAALAALRCGKRENAEQLPPGYTTDYWGKLKEVL